MAVPYIYRPAFLSEIRLYFLAAFDIYVKSGFVLHMALIWGKFFDIMNIVVIKNLWRETEYELS